MSNAKTLVVFYSRTGTTRRVAEVIAAELAADVEEIVDKKSRGGPLGWLSGGRDATLRRTAEIEEPKNDPAGYDLVVIGSPVWAWSMTPAVRAYLKRQKERLPQVAFFALAGSSGAEKTVAAMAALAGKEPRATLALARGFGLSDKLLERARHFARGLVSPQQ